MDMHIHDFHVNDLPTGTKQAGWLSIAPRSGGGDWRLPYLAVVGNRPGPTMVVFAGVHGDEYEGIEAIPQVYQTVSPDVLRGRLLMISVCNVPAYEAALRSSPIDRLNLARVYPGDPAGTITQQIAYWTAQRLISQADLFIDLHSGGIAYNICTLIGYIHDDGDLGSRSLAAARAFGAPVLWGHPLPMPPGRTISLATELGIPALYTEAPGGGAARPEDVACFKQGVLNVMRHLDMLPGELEPQPTTHHLIGHGNLDSVLSAPTPGLFRASVNLLDKVEAGQPLGKLYDLHGTVTATIEADQSGIVIMLRRILRVHTGDGLVHVTGELTPSP
jgi:predicted deacylase